MEIAGRVSRALATWGRASTIPGQFAKIPEFRFGEVGIVVTNVLIIDNYLNKNMKYKNLQKYCK